MFANRSEFARVASAQSPLIDSPDRSVEIVIRAAQEVSNILGAGFLEEVYCRALARALTLQGLRINSEIVRPCSQAAYYRAPVAVLRVNEQLLVELRCGQSLSDEYIAQCASRLEAFNLNLALLINFRKSEIEWQWVELAKLLRQAGTLVYTDHLIQ